MSSPTILTSPTPLIQNQPGTINYYIDIADNSSNIFPAPSTTYSLQNRSGTELSTFQSYPFNEDLSSNFNYNLSTPAASTFDSNGYLYVVDTASSTITAFTPNFFQSNEILFSQAPFGIKWNPRDGNLYVTCLFFSPGSTSVPQTNGAILKLTSNYNNSLNPTGVDFIYKTLFNGTGNVYDTPASNFCYVPYDIEFDNSGNLLISNFGYYPDPLCPQVPGFISKLFIENNVITDAAVIISPSVSNGITKTAGGKETASCRDTNLSYPSGMAYDLSNNYLYVANVNSENGSGVITMYSMNNNSYPGIQKLLTINNVGNNSAFSIANGMAITSLKFDNYGNLYYIVYDDKTSTTYIQAISIIDNGNYFSYNLVYSKIIQNIVTSFNPSVYNSAYGLGFYNGNMYMTGDFYTSLNMKVNNSILSIQNAFTFKNVALNESQTLVITPNSSPASLNTLNVYVSGGTMFVSNPDPYTKQATILTYFDNINNVNELVPTSDYIYNLIDASLNSIVSSVQVENNNEILYAPYSNELSTLNNPISMDFDSSGNLYVLNSTTNKSVFLNIITPGSGNLGKVYSLSVSILYPSAIRYNKNDNCMYISSFDVNFFGTIDQVQTTILYNNSDQVQFNLTTTKFYSCDGTTDFCRNPMDLVFDTSFNSGEQGYLYISCAGSELGNLNLFPGNAVWNANITRIVIDYTTSYATCVQNSETIIVGQESLSNYVSGIEVDEDYIYLVNAPDDVKYFLKNSSKSEYGNYYPNISQFSKITGELIQRFNAGYVGKLPDNLTNSGSNFPMINVISTLKFDQYGNLFYITYYDRGNYHQPYYLDSSGEILYNVPTSGNYYVQAFVPSSGIETPVFTHKMVFNPLKPINGLALYNGDIYVSQYTQNQIIKLTYSLSFGNFGFGLNGTQSSLILYNQNNEYYITGGNAPVYGLAINASPVNYAFATATITTNPNPLIANSPGTLTYYDNPATSSPNANTTYVLVNSNGKNISNSYTSPPGNETTIIYNNLSAPRCIAVDSEGYLYIANGGHEGVYQTGTIIKSTTAGKIIYIKQNVNITSPFAITYNPIDGYIYYANNAPNNISGSSYFYIYKMSTDGNTFTQVVQDSNYNYLYTPLDMCFDSLGNIYITNAGVNTSAGKTINGSITKITMGYPPLYSSATPLSLQVFSNYLSGFPLNSAGVVVVSGVAIDTITNYLYVVAGTPDPSINNISICQIPTTGNDAGKVCRKWQTGITGNAQGQTALNFDTYGNLYYYYYNPISGVTTLNGFNPYTNTSSTYSHTLLGGATSGAYGIVYYNGNFYSGQSFYNKTTNVFIDNVVKINASYFFTGVTLQGGNNVLSINTAVPNKVAIENINVNVSTAIYYTIPSPPIAGEPAQLIFEYDDVVIPVNDNIYVVVDKNMNYVSATLTYTSENQPNPFIFIFDDLILPGGANYLYIFNITTGQIVPGTNMLIKIPVVCFYKGTKILCLINGKEMYVPIEKIGQGTLIKTYKRGYRKVKYNIMGKLNNTAEHSIDKLYKLSKKRFPELIEDLYVTGSHALLHDSLNDREVVLMKKVIQFAVANFNSIYNAKIEDKFKLLAYHDERFEEIMMNAVFEIYHIVLENEDKNFNYGIYANGILAESTDELTLMRMKGFEKINKTPEGLELFVNSMNKTKYPAQLQRALKR